MDRYKTVLALNIAVFLMMSGVGMVMAILPAKMIAFTGSSSSVGYLATVFAAFYLLFQIPIGRLADRIGFRLLIGSGFVICGCSGMIYCQADGSGALLVGRALQGIGEVPVWALAPALLSVLYPGKKGRVMGFYNASFHLGLSAGPFTGILLERLFRNPDAPFYFYIAASLAGGLLVWMAAENPVRGRRPEISGAKTASLQQITRGGRIRIILAGVVLYGTGYGFFVTLIPAYLIADKRFAPTEIGVYFTLFYMTISVVQLAAGPLSDRCGKSGFMIAGMLLAAIGITFFSGFNKLGLLWMLTTSGFGLGLFFVTSMACLNETVGEDQKGIVSGVYFLAWGAGYFLGPLIAGILGKVAGMDSCFQFYGGLLFLETAALLLWKNDCVPDGGHHGQSPPTGE
jgi:MFS family permease